MSDKNKKTAASIAMKEHCDRMRARGFAKYSLMLKKETMTKVATLADKQGLPCYQLIENILAEYLIRTDKK